MSEHEPYVEEYRALRSELTELHHELIGRLSRKTIKAAQRKLKLHRMSLYEEAVDTAQVALFDYALYHARPGGRTLFEAYFEEHPPAPDSPLDRFRQALDTYRYTIVEVDTAEEDVGVEVYDVLAEKPLFLMDRNLAGSAPEGMVMASGILQLPDYAMTTGAALPLQWSTLKRIAQDATRLLGDLSEVDFEALPPKKASDLAARIIRRALRDDAGSRIGYR